MRTTGAGLASGSEAGSLSGVEAGLSKGGSDAGATGCEAAAFASSSEENKGFMTFLQREVTT
jgi:hypothetical protein